MAGARVPREQMIPSSGTGVIVSVEVKTPIVKACSEEMTCWRYSSLTTVLGLVIQRSEGKANFMDQWCSIANQRIDSDGHPQSI